MVVACSIDYCKLNSLSFELFALNVDEVSTQVNSTSNSGLDFTQSTDSTSWSQMVKAEPASEFGFSMESDVDV